MDLVRILLVLIISHADFAFPEQYREVISACFQYLDLLRSSPLPQWHFEESKELADIRFRFAEKSSPDSYATNISTHMKWPTPRELVISGPSLLWDWDEKLVRKVLEGLSPESGRVFVMGKNMDEIDVNGPWEAEKWYGTEYKVEKMTVPKVSIH